MDKSKRDRIFLSYAEEDLDIVCRVFDGLIKRQLNVWFDKKHLGPGRWKPQILKAINRSRLFVICISNAALRKTGDERPGFQDEELNTAYNIAQTQPDNEFAIIPVRLEDCGRGDFRLSSFQQYDLFNDFDKELDKLAINLNGISLSDATARDERTENEKIIDHLLDKAQIAYYARDYDKAIIICDSVLVMVPDHAGAWLDKGVALGQRGRLEESLAAFDKAIKINSDDADAWYNQGVTLRELGRREESLAAYSKAIKINPDHDRAWYNQGVAFAKLGRREEALAAFGKVITISPDHGNAWDNRGVMLGELGRYEEAVAAYDKAIKINPNHANAWRNKGVALRELGRREESLAAFDKAIKINPNLEAPLLTTTLDKTIRRLTTIWQKLIGFLR